MEAKVSLILSYRAIFKIQRLDHVTSQHKCGALLPITNQTKSKQGQHGVVLLETSLLSLITFSRGHCMSCQARLSLPKVPAFTFCLLTPPSHLSTSITHSFRSSQGLYITSCDTTYQPPRKKQPSQTLGFPKDLFFLFFFLGAGVGWLGWIQGPLWPRLPWMIRHSWLRITLEL